MADNVTREQRSENMRRIRGRDTGPELALRRALWHASVRGYRVHVRGIPGTPDIVWRRARVAVFVDGGFWHGHPDVYRWGRKGEYWDDKVRRNIARDREVDSKLAAEGWQVLRFWDFDVLKDPARCVAEVRRALAAAEPGR